YKDFSAVEAAVNAVVRGKNITEQAEVDLMAENINNAVAALEYKDADYAETDKAIAKANALNPDNYKDFSAVEAAVNAVVRGKNITEQAEVDLMAENINNAVAALEKKPKPNNEKPEEKAEQKTDTKINNSKKAQTKSPETGSSALSVSALSITAGIFILGRKKRRD
ncbi:hypothetical protein, partial [uncultured Eubacterium sp.]|uniref:hypothetical protein n=1 Tax=uncultured Eubacterium sp. TaxID=165185 RepID=UPI0034343CFE